MWPSTSTAAIPRWTTATPRAVSGVPPTASGVPPTATAAQNHRGDGRVVAIVLAQQYSSATEAMLLVSELALPTADTALVAAAWGTGQMTALDLAGSALMLHSQAVHLCSLHLHSQSIGKLSRRGLQSACPFAFRPVLLAGALHLKCPNLQGLHMCVQQTHLVLTLLFTIWLQ